MTVLFVIGRILFGGFFIMNGINHFTNVGTMSQYAEAKGVPAPGVAVPVSGVIILLGGLSVLLGLWVKIGVLLLAVFLIPTSLMMHNFWAIEDPETSQNEQIQFMKNMALLGASLMFLLIPSPWPVGLM